MDRLDASDASATRPDETAEDCPSQPLPPQDPNEITLRLFVSTERITRGTPFGEVFGGPNPPTELVEIAADQGCFIWDTDDPQLDLTALDGSYVVRHPIVEGSEITTHSFQPLSEFVPAPTPTVTVQDGHVRVLTAIREMPIGTTIADITDSPDEWFATMTVPLHEQTPQSFRTPRELFRIGPDLANTETIRSGEPLLVSSFAPIYSDAQLVLRTSTGIPAGTSVSNILESSWPLFCLSVVPPEDIRPDAIESYAEFRALGLGDKLLREVVTGTQVTPAHFGHSEIQPSVGLRLDRSEGEPPLQRCTEVVLRAGREIPAGTTVRELFEDQWHYTVVEFLPQYDITPASGSFALSLLDPSRAIIAPVAPGTELTDDLFDTAADWVLPAGVAVVPVLRARHDVPTGTTVDELIENADYYLTVEEGRSDEIDPATLRSVSDLDPEANGSDRAINIDSGDLIGPRSFWTPQPQD